MLKNINEDKLRAEQATLDRIDEAINSKRSFIFNAGAGAGKTYALIETLKYICRQNEDMLIYNNQKILCITYTNVAANEVKERLGKTDSVLVSTIHDRLWDIIKDYQKELVDIHKYKMECEIEKLSSEINNNTFRMVFTDEEWECFTKNLITNEKEFYSICKLNAALFKEKICNIFPEISDIKISNVSTFKDICKKSIKKYKYVTCIEKILEDTKQDDGRYNKVIYNSKYNHDVLYKMRISHDTLLEYARLMIINFPVLKRIIIDKYPYILIDEYQDTSETVINIVQSLYDYGKEIKHNIIVGYFGDSVQNIYTTGVGKRIFSFTDDFIIIDKIFNRRSCKEIISLANYIRKDKIYQESIYEDSSGGKVEFYVLQDGTEQEKEIDTFIKMQSKELLSQEGGEEYKQVHCFLLKNELVAKKNGITDLYDWFSKESEQYRNGNYEYLNPELLSNDVSKLGRVQSLIYYLIDFYIIVKDDKNTYMNLFKNRKFLNEFTIDGIRKLSKCLEEIKGNTLGELLISINLLKENIKQLNLHSEDTINELFSSLFGLDEFSFDNFKAEIREVSFDNRDDMTEEDCSNVDASIEKLMNISMDILLKWHSYVNRSTDEEIVYHTFHGTKGLEFENVILVFGDEFGRNKRFFSDYFINLDKEDANTNDTYEQARNLLYVAVTRAIKNLKILYTGQCRTDAEKIFGKAKEWPLI